MVEAWLMDDEAGEPSAEHRRHPNVPVSLQVLADLGVLYFAVPEEGREAWIDVLAQERQYKNRDVVSIVPDKMPPGKMASFFEEHLHEDEEIRCILEGSGYFDVRDGEDRWIRIHLVAGDLIILPAGIYHRFTVDSHAYTKAMRLFKDEPKWTPINRPADNNPFRIAYVQGLQVPPV